MRKTDSLLLLALAMCACCAKPSAAQQWMENLDRGVVAVNEGADGVFVSWRLLGNESADLGFDVFRHSGDHTPVKLNRQPLVGATHFQDRGADLSLPTRYLVRPLGDAMEMEGAFTLPANPPVQRCLSIPLRTPEGYHANDTSVGDLDGDGQYELVVHMVGQGRDNSQSGITTEPILHVYKLNGTFLWSVNLGKNIREGAHYTQFMVYDLDGDGKAEIVCKTADGTVDGNGTVIGDATADHRRLPPESSSRRRARGDSRVGYILKGPEYLTVFNGETGAAMATVDYVPQRHPDTDSPTPGQMQADWGDDYGNRMDRFLACVAYLDGESPSVVMTRGYYTRTGKIYFAAAHGRDVGRGMAADIDPRHPGYELWGGTRFLFDVNGNDIGPRPRSQNMAIWWDGDLLRELLNGVEITKWDYEHGVEQRIFDGRRHGVASNNGSKANPCLVADVIGDWREELIARTSNSRELRIYTTTLSTEHRMVTLMHDLTYRMSVAGQNVGYNQPPHPGFFLGDQMRSPSRGRIQVIKPNRPEQR